MSTLSLPPLPATGFRSKDGWGNPELHDTREPGFSNFRFVESYFDKKENVNTLIRILSLAKQLRYKCLFKEKLSDDNPLKIEEDRKVKENNGNFEKSEIIRLSFFSSSLEIRPESKDFLGYAVIKADFYKDRPTHIYVYESVLKPHRLENNSESTRQPECRINFLHCRRQYEIESILGKFSVEGAMYAQQNGKNFICAHVALRSVLSLINDADISYDEINRIAGRPPYAQNGLTPAQIDDVLKEKGVASRRISRKQFPEMGLSSFSPILYGYIESGCPSLLAFCPHGGRVGHIVPVFGHTFDPDSWVPESRNGYFAGDNQYYSSEGWLDSFLIHDDNFGPYQTLPRNYFEEDGEIILWGLHKDRAALCFERIETRALGACWYFISKNKWQERLGLDWYNRFLHCANARKLVLRSLYINKEDYIKHATKISLDANNLSLLQSLPDKLWMVELSCRELFSATRAKFGEILLTVDNVDDDFSGTYTPLVLRLPGAVHFYKTSVTNNTTLIERTPLFSQ